MAEGGSEGDPLQQDGQLNMAEGGSEGDPLPQGGQVNMAERDLEEHSSQQGQLGHQITAPLGTGPNFYNIVNSQVTIVEGQRYDRQHESTATCRTPDIISNIAKSTKEMMGCTGGYVETEASERALELVNFKGRVLLMGSRGSGKTALGLHLLRKLTDRTPLMLTDPQQWNLIPRPRNWGSIKSAEKYAVFIDDVIGKYTMNTNVLDHWERMFDFIEPMICSGQVVVIASSASIIVNMFCGRSTFLNFFSQQRPVDIDSFDYTPSQKMEILSSITRHRHGLSKEEIEKLTSITLNRGFVACCQYFTKNEKVRKRGIKFFQRPVELLNDEIEDLFEKRKIDYMSLLWILYQSRDDSEDQFSSRSQQDSMESITSLLPGSHFTQIEFKHAAESLKGTFLKFVPETNSYEFIDQMIHDAVARNFLSKFPDIALSLCPLHIIVEYSCLLNMERDKCLVVPIQEEALAKRLSSELYGSNFQYVISHAAFRDKDFLAFLDRKGFIKTKNFLKLKLNYETFTEFEHAFDIFKLKNYLGKKLKLFSYRTKFSFIVMKGLDHFARLLLRNLLKAIGRYQQVLNEVLPCFCYQGSVLAMLMLKESGIKPGLSCLLACAAAPKESLGLLMYVCECVRPNSAMLGLMLSMTLQQGYGESSRFLLDELSEYRHPSLMTKLFYQIILQCHGKDGRIFRESQSGIALERYKGEKIDWAKYINLGYFVSKLTKNVQESVAKWLILKAAGTSLCSAVEKLLEINPSLVFAKAPRSETLLHLACKDGSKEMVKFFLCKDIDGNQRDEKGYFALHYAVTSLYDPIAKIQLFSQKGVDVNCETKNKQTALHLACSSGLDLVLQELLTIVSRDSINYTDDQGNTPLHLSSRVRRFTTVNPSEVWNYEKCVSVLLEAGADVNLKNNKGITALHFSAAAHLESIMNCLIENGANLNEQDEHGNPPLFMNARSVPFLVSKGADFTIRNDDGNTILHVLHMFNDKIEWIVCQNKESVSEAMKVLKEKGADMNAQNIAGQTCLHVAFRDLKYFDHLRECHVDENITDNHGQTVHHYLTDLSAYQLTKLEPVLQMQMENVLDENGDGAIHLAAANGFHFSLACLIDKAKADVNLKNAKHQTALHIATEKGHWKGICLLLQNKPSLNEKDLNGETPLLAASGRPGFADKVHMLLRYGADVNCQDTKALTPLHRAIHRNLTDVVKVLSHHYGCRHDIRDGQGNIPLHTACYRNNFDIIPDVVGNVSNLSIKDEQGNTAIHLLVSKKTMQLEPYLKKNGLRKADIPVRMMKKLSQRRRNRLTNGHGPSWLSMYVLKREQPLKTMKRKEYFIKFLWILARLLPDNQRAHPLFRNIFERCRTALLDQGGRNESIFKNKKRRRAVLIEPLKETTSLIQRCSDLNIQNNEGNTPLHVAALSGSWKIVKELLKKAAVIRRNIKGETPLHLAVYRDHMMSVKLLLQNDVDRKSMDYEGNTPIHLAGLCGHTNVLLMLLASASSDGVKQLKKVFKQDISKKFQRPELSSDLIGSFDLEMQNASGETVLHAAVRGGWLKMVKGLLLLGSSLATRNNVGMSAADLARGHLKRNPSQLKTYSRMLYLFKRASESECLG